jgi:HAD superfamily hydrolase (TIGR01459 family)
MPLVAPRILAGLQEIAPRYDVALVDVWGVIHNGHAPFAAALEACRRFRAERGPVILVSNAPRPSTDLPVQFRRLGAGDDFYDAIVTSGDATQAELAARAPGPAYRLGPPKDERLYDGLDMAFADIETATFISCTGPVEEDTDQVEDYADVFATAAARGVDMVCANPDLVVQKGDRLILCAGALAADFERRGGRVVHCGKPHQPIYDLALTRAAALRGAAVSPARVLAIGDGPDTDLLGAERQGFDALFIADGIHREDVLANGSLDAGEVAALLSGKGRRAGYAMAALTW